MRRAPAALLLLAATLGATAPAAAQQEEHERERELVVLVHGLGRSPLSMLALAHDLENAGYRVLNWGYSSTCCSIADIGGSLQHDLEQHRGRAPAIHFVGHSLGNLIIRWALTEGTPPGAVGRVVMLAPPNQGSHEADRYGRWLGGVLKPLPELTTDSTSTARTLGIPAGVEIGIIAGEADGKVLVEETMLPGAAHIVVPGAHSFLMFQPDVRRLVLRFLRTGRWDQPAPSSTAWTTRKTFGLRSIPG